VAAPQRPCGSDRGCKLVKSEFQLTVPIDECCLVLADIADIVRPSLEDEIRSRHQIGKASM